MRTILLISTTFDNKEDAARIAGLLLDRRLIACAHISGPITSLYRWQGQVNNTPEYTLSVKSIAQHWQALQDILMKEHPYELPEIIGQEIQHVSNAYYDWVCGEVQ